MASRTAFLLLFALILAGTLPAQGPGDFDDIVIFGDSLSDQGNIAAATFGFVPGPAYFNGRFSNGPVWVETVAAGLGLSTSATGLGFSLAGGNNFAVGGARVSSSQNFLFLTLPGIRAQIAAYLTSAPASTLPTTLHVVGGGANDIRDALDPTFSLGGLTDLQYVTMIAQELAAGVQDLVDAGAYHVVVGNAPDLGLTPEATILENNAVQATALCTHFNQELALALDAIRQTEAVCILEFDFFGLTQDLANDALQGGIEYGITNATLPALPGVAGSPGFDPAVSLFWDDLHPTAAGHLVGGLRVIEQLATERFPGSNEDLVLELRVDGAAAPAACPAQAVVGQTVELAFRSPGGTWNGAAASLLGQAFPFGAPPLSPAGFPELHVNAQGAVVLGVFGVFAGATPLSVPVLPGLEGTHLVLQAVVSAPAAANGIFVASDARELSLR